MKKDNTEAREAAVLAYVNEPGAVRDQSMQSAEARAFRAGWGAHQDAIKPPKAQCRATLLIAGKKHRCERNSISGPHGFEYCRTHTELAYRAELDHA